MRSWQCHLYDVTFWQYRSGRFVANIINSDNRIYGDEEIEEQRRLRLEIQKKLKLKYRQTEIAWMTRSLDQEVLNRDSEPRGDDLEFYTGKDIPCPWH